MNDKVMKNPCSSWLKTKTIWDKGSILHKSKPNQSLYKKSIIVLWLLFYQIPSLFHAWKMNMNATTFLGHRKPVRNTDTIQWICNNSACSIHFCNVLYPIYSGYTSKIPAVYKLFRQKKYIKVPRMTLGFLCNTAHDMSNY